MSDCRFGVSPVNYPDPDPGLCTADTVEVETYLVNDKCEIFCGRWSLEFLHTQQ